jgi:hypothetical protein
MSDTDTVSTQTRTVSSVLFHLFILQFSVTAAVGHLGSLRKFDTTTHVWFVVFSILFPLWPCLDTLRLLLLTLWHWNHLSIHGLLYLLNCIAGASISPRSNEDESIALVILVDSPVHVNQNREDPFSWKFLGRISVLLAILVQVVLTLVLILRRAYIVGILFSGADIHALACCVSGLCVVLSSIIIQLCENRWQTTPQIPAPGSRTSQVSKFELRYRRLYIVTLAAVLLPFIILIVQAGQISVFGVWVLVLVAANMVLGALLADPMGVSCVVGVLFMLSGCLVVAGSVSPVISASLICEGFGAKYSQAWQWYDPWSDLLWVY